MTEVRVDAIEAKYQGLEDPGIRAFMIAGERLYPPDAVNFSIGEQRDFYNHYCAHFRKPRPSGVAVEDFSVGDIPCRRYCPQGQGKALLLYLHGGGFVVGGLESHDDVCAEIADQARVETVAVEYSLAPEHVFPSALDECWTVLRELAKEKRPLLLAGDSAGANLAAALCLRARDEDGPDIAGQVLIYPGLGGDVTKGSYIAQANAPGLSTADVLYYRDTYKGAPHPYAEPLKASSLASLPPAFLVAAGHDPLHDDCFAYAEKLRAAGGMAEVLVHAFLRARHMSTPAAMSFAAIVEAIRRFSVP
jgi:acetyl esterase